MAITQVSAMANYGHGGALGSKAYLKKSRPESIIPAFCDLQEMAQGAPSQRWSLWGDPIDASAWAESSDVAGAITITTIPTASPVDIAPVGYAASMSVSDMGYYRAISDNNPLEHIKNELAYAVSRYLAVDSSVGLTYQFTQASASASNSGLPLTKEAILDAAATVHGNLNDHSIPLVCVIDGVGKKQLQESLSEAGGSIYASVAMADEVKNVIRDNPFLNDNNYFCTFAGNVHVFVEAADDALIQDSGDRIGAVFVPANGIVGDTKGVAPAFGIAYATPMSASSLSVVSAVDYRETAVGTVALAQRSYTGIGAQTYDARGYGACGIISQNSVCKLPYLA